MSVKTYDPAQVILNIGGVQMSGFADGTFITFERDEDAFTKHTGADGEVARAKSNNKSGSLTLTLAQTSSSNDVLSAFAIADELNNSGVVPALMKDLNGNTIAAAASAWIRKQPNSEFAKEISNREWIIDLARVDYTVGGNATQTG